MSIFGGNDNEKYLRTCLKEFSNRTPSQSRIVSASTLQVCDGWTLRARGKPRGI